jgi:S-adenosylmethionine:tRNA-ribosyltransferase-isomerase (queuine synthetase)
MTYANVGSLPSAGLHFTDYLLQKQVSPLFIVHVGKNLVK